MSTPEPPAVTGQDDVIIQATTGLADLPTGQRAAIMITVLCGKDAALLIAKAIEAAAGQLSSSGLVVPGPNGVTDAVAQRPV